MNASEVIDVGAVAEATLTIDELALASQVPSRTIRWYQSKGVLPRPEIRGRVAFYGDAHVERLKLIASLQDRGLSIDGIRDLVARIDKGELDVGEWFGLDAQLQQPWGDDRPLTLDAEALYELAGRRRVGLLADLQRAELVERRGDVFLVPSPAIVRIAGRLESAGIDVHSIVRGHEVLKKHLDRAARDLTDLFVKEAGTEIDPEAIAEVRPAVLEAVRVVFAQAMEREVRNLVESGKTARVRKKRR
jgi:DNA-binding transcriptional MerR regulator